jgi:hypothetical protein
VRKSVVEALTIGNHAGAVDCESGVSRTQTVRFGTLHGCKVSPSFSYATLARPTHRPVATPDGVYSICTPARLP